MKKPNESGFSVPEVLLILLVILTLSAVGYFVWHKKHTTQLSNATNLANQQGCDETCLENNFQQIKLPSSFNLVSKIWLKSVDTNHEFGIGNMGPSWGYTFLLPTIKLQQDETDFHNAESAAGYLHEQQDDYKDNTGIYRDASKTVGAVPSNQNQYAVSFCSSSPPNISISELTEPSDKMTGTTTILVLVEYSGVVHAC